MSLSETGIEMRQRTDHSAARCGTRVGATKLPQIKPQGTQCSKGLARSAMPSVATLHTLGHRWGVQFSMAPRTPTPGTADEAWRMHLANQKGEFSFWQFYFRQTQPYHQKSSPQVHCPNDNRPIVGLYEDDRLADDGKRV